VQSRAADPGAASAKGPVIGGEQFVKREIPDPAQGGLAACYLFLPQSWRLDSKLEWHYGWVEYPVSMTIKAENPASVEAYYAYPLLKLVYIQVPPALQQYARNIGKPGERTGTGPIWLQPLPPVQIMTLFINQQRGNVANLKWIGQQQLPGLAKALGIPDAPSQQGIGVKIGYDLNGKPVEEVFLEFTLSTRAIRAVRAVS